MGNLSIFRKPRLENPRLLMGLSGWMDGGDVSTGTVKYFVDSLGAESFAEIEPEGFYIYSFPGSMEMSAMFRPHTRIEDGLIKTYEPPKNIFYCSEKDNLILFAGKEPNMLWRGFGDCFLEVCGQFGVGMIYFIGSVSGLIPHSREPRIFCSVSDSELLEKIGHYGIKFSSYEGPASFVTYLTGRCGEAGPAMASLVATIPAYVQGYNPKCIESVVRRLAGILGVHLELGELLTASDEFEKKLNRIVNRQPELAKNIRKLEEDYDNEIFNSEMGELKTWLQQQGIRVD